MLDNKYVHSMHKLPNYQLAENATLDFWQLKSLIDCTMVSIRKVQYVV